MSSMTVNFPAADSLIRTIRKKWGGDAFISMCGGAHASGDPAGALQAGFDWCCAGEGEDAIREVAECLAAGESLESVEGIYRLEGEHLVGKPRSRPVDLSRYAALPRRVRFPTYIEIGRGCRWQCAYCQTPGIHGHRERFRSVAEVEETVSVYRAFGMRDFRFLLPNALGYAAQEARKPNCEALETLLARCRSAAKGGRIFLGSFPSEVRPDYVTDDAVRILKAHVSNNKIVIGGQSGSQRMLDLIGRGHTVEDIGYACQLILSCGLQPAVDMVLGFPGETGEDRQATIRLVERLGSEGTTFYMHFFMPLPGTPLAACDPVFLTEQERRRLDRLAQRGIVRGRWRRQEELAGKWLRQDGVKGHRRSRSSAA
jgi:B12-binding domain/radical SAM domain protein